MFVDTSHIEKGYKTFQYNHLYSYNQSVKVDLVIQRESIQHLIFFYGTECRVATTTLSLS